MNKHCEDYEAHMRKIRDYLEERLKVCISVYCCFQEVEKHFMWGNEIDSECHFGKVALQSIHCNYDEKTFWNQKGLSTCLGEMGGNEVQIESEKRLNFARRYENITGYKIHYKLIIK